MYNIDKEEALIIATEALEESDNTDEFNVKSGKIIKGTISNKYSNVWLVEFTAKGFLAKALQKYLVVIDKVDGRIIIQNVWWPDKQKLEVVLNSLFNQ